MDFNNRQLTIIYNFENQNNREALAYARSLTDHIQEIDLSKEPLTESQLAEIVEKMEVDIHELINKQSGVYKEKFVSNELDYPGWVRALVNNPEMIKTPLCFYNYKRIIVNTPSDILKLEPEGGFTNFKP